MNYKHTTLEISSIFCNSLIGCNDDERLGAQELEIDLLIELGDINTTDNLAQTVDYWEICDFVKDFVSKTEYYLLETLSEQIAQTLIDKYELIKVITVSVCKPSLNNQKSRYIKCHYKIERRYKVALALGSNMNNPRQQIISATELLAEFVSDIKVAPIYKSSPYGYLHQDDFYNTCISGYTILSPDELLIQIKKLEKLQGKSEQFINGPRIIDIDIIFYSNIIFNKGWLNIPHHAMHERDFVLLPLSKIEPEWQHPKYDLSVSELLSKLDTSRYILAE